MKKNLYPISINSYHLNFSFPGSFNLESRIFLTIPYVGEFIQEKLETNLLTICFEMNSIFNLGRNNSFGEDLGLKIMLSSEKVLISGKNIEKDYGSYWKEKEEKEIKTFFYQDEKELYKNIITSFENFIKESHGEKWMEFFLLSREKYKNKTPVVFLVKDNTNLGEDIIKEHEKISKFTIDATNRLRNILDSQTFGYEELTKNNVSYSNNNVFPQILPKDKNISLEADELIKINRRWQYYKLSDSLNSENKQKLNKPIKI